MKNRLLIFGLDGGTDSVLRLPDARCHTIGRLRSQGASGRLYSTLPPVTAAAWPSMVTGLEPGQHGIYDFQRIPFDRYPDDDVPRAQLSLGSERFHDSNSWAGYAFWDILGDSVKAAVLGVPMTYPLQPINGVTVAGFPLPNYDRNFVYPATFDLDAPPILQGAENQVDLSPEEIAELCRDLVERQATLARGFMLDRDYDIVFAVFQRRTSHNIDSGATSPIIRIRFAKRFSTSIGPSITSLGRSPDTYPTPTSSSCLTTDSERPRATSCDLTESSPMPDCSPQFATRNVAISA
jgi:predicted AlkP superfamily phosphohydrolase/phosphomutase